MSQWNRTTLPTEADADDWGNILVMDDNARKGVYHWKDYVEGGMMEDGDAWMSLPSADDVEDETKQISIAITAGDRTVTIKKVNDTIEIHDSEDPMGQPVGWQDVGVGIEGLLTTVEAVLIDEIMNEPEEESTGCCKNCKCKRETPRQSNGSIYGAHWAW